MAQKYTATHRIACPLYNYTPGGVAIVCGKKFTGKGESYHSQQDAENVAEADCYRKFNGHALRSHNR